MVAHETEQTAPTQRQPSDAPVGGDVNSNGGSGGVDESQAVQGNGCVRVNSIQDRKDMFYLTTHSTHFISGYMASDTYMVKDHSDSERGNPMPPLHGLLFLISSKGSFICIIP